jgi:hypothetical protein
MSELFASLLLALALLGLGLALGLMVVYTLRALRGELARYQVRSIVRRRLQLIQDGRI